MRNHHIATSSLVIESVRDRLFDLTQDHNLRLQWDKYLRKIELLDGATTVTVGVKAMVSTVTGISMETMYIIFERPNRIAVEMIDRSRLFKAFNGEWIFTEMKSGRTELKINYHYTLRFPFTIISKVVKARLEAGLMKRLRLLKTYIETAQAANIGIGKSGRPTSRQNKTNIHARLRQCVNVVRNF